MSEKGENNASLIAWMLGAITLDVDTCGGGGHITLVCDVIVSLWP
jgi:hypothetical protein